MPAYIFTGRFQPLHNGHIHFLEAVKKRHPDDLLIICVIRNSAGCEKAVSNSAFHVVSNAKQVSVNNPMPNWNRYRLLSLAVKASEILRDNTEIIFRDRSDLDFQKSISDLPEDRVWLFPNYAKEAFDAAKIAYYQNQNETIELVDFYDSSDMFSGTAIRDMLKTKDKEADLSFLPKACREYFRNECMKYH
jgi:cytidyltransferase-like protein